MTKPLRLYPFPPPRIVLPAPSTAALDRMTPRQAEAAIHRSWDFSTHVLRWMGRIGLRYIRHRLNAHLGTPDVEDLMEWIVDRTHERGKRWIVSMYDDPHPGEFRILWEEVEQKAREAAEFALREFEYSRRDRYVYGGQVSKRPATWTDADLDALAAMGGSKAEQARRTGRAPRTIARMRRALRERG